jgi:hypothetical protein
MSLGKLRVHHARVLVLTISIVFRTIPRNLFRQNHLPPMSPTCHSFAACGTSSHDTVRVQMILFRMNAPTVVSLLVVLVQIHP